MCYNVTDYTNTRIHRSICTRENMHSRDTILICKLGDTYRL